MASKESTLAAYEAAYQLHRQISDFRAKLLALLPLASGAGLFIIFGKPLNEGVIIHLAAVGTLGLAVTVGLYLFELRALSRMHALELVGRMLEMEMGLKCGTFLVGYARRGRVIRSTVGSRIVYSSLMAAWFYVLSMGVLQLTAGAELAEAGGYIGWLLLSVCVFFLAALILSQRVESRQREKQRDQEEELQAECVTV